MSDADGFYWRTFNVLLRLLGLGATFAGTVVVLGFGLGLGAGPGGSSIPALLAGLLLAFLGLGFLLLRPFRPDLGDSGIRFAPSSAEGRRRWWTGDRLE
jgi:hypothetical protein